MAFTMTRPATYRWPVTVEIAIDGGQFEKATFDAEFKRVSQSRVAEIVDSQFGASTNMTDNDVVREIMAGWNGVTDGGTDIPFSQSALDSLIDIPGVTKAIVKAWLDSLTGAQRKN